MESTHIPAESDVPGGSTRHPHRDGPTGGQPGSPGNLGVEASCNSEIGRSKGQWHHGQKIIDSDPGLGDAWLAYLALAPKPVVDDLYGGMTINTPTLDSDFARCPV